MIELYCDESRQDLFYNRNAISNTNKYIFIGGVMINRENRREIKNKINELKQKYKNVFFAAKYSDNQLYNDEGKGLDNINEEEDNLAYI